jgi:release factor glutamine methyltransferase
MRFFVNEDVLIPRPETEELVEMIATGGRILDIGTGSGCIPIALKKKYPAAEIFACDISEAALQIARHNSQANEAAVQFIQYDILNKNDWDKLPKVDIIVSNPPYIPEKDKGTMHKNVLNNEPHQALFVPDNDPLIFYKTIAELTPVLSAKTIYLEIHEEQGNPVVQLLKDRNFTNIELKRDMQGKERMIKGAFCSS